MLIFTLPVSFLPGPNNLLSAVHSSKFGFTKTLPLILGMVIGWFLLGIAVGFGAVFIEQNSMLLTVLTYAGVMYMIYLSYKITFSFSSEDPDFSSETLGTSAGMILQIVNGKAFIHLLILMTVFGSAFGTDFIGKMIIALLNVLIKLTGWIAWALFGTTLKIQFNDKKSGIFINRAFGFSLFCVAIWIAIPR